MKSKSFNFDIEILDTTLRDGARVLHAKREDEKIREAWRTANVNEMKKA